jgi:hypothetical protein
MRSSKALHDIDSDAARARITWFRFSEGGRRELPTTLKYRSVARFDEDPNNTLGSWDVLVRFADPPAYEHPSLATVSFLSENAPMQLLHAGSRFELTEGRKVVARVQIVE